MISPPSNLTEHLSGRGISPPLRRKHVCRLGGGESPTFHVTLHDSMDEDEDADEQETHDSTGLKPVTIENEPEIPQVTSVDNALDFSFLPPMKTPFHYTTSDHAKRDTEPPPLNDHVHLLIRLSTWPQAFSFLVVLKLHSSFAMPCKKNSLNHGLCHSLPEVSSTKNEQVFSPV